MSHFEDAIELVFHAERAIGQIQSEYSSSLNEKTIKKSLLIEIKNFMENLRSALDYAAHGLFDKYGTSSKSNPRIYFPYAKDDQSESDFLSSNRIESCIPGISTSRPDIVDIISSFQHFAVSYTHLTLPTICSV